MRKSIAIICLIAVAFLAAGCGVKNTAQSYTDESGFTGSAPCFAGRKVAVYAQWSPDMPTESARSNPYVVTARGDVLGRTENSKDKLNESTGGKMLLASVQLENQFQYMLADAIGNAGVATDLVVPNRNAFNGMTDKSRVAGELERLKGTMQAKLALDGYDYYIVTSNRQKLPGAKSILKIDGHNGSEAIRGFLTFGLDKLAASDTDTHTYTWDREVKVVRLSDGKTVYEKTFRTNETRDIEVHEGSLVKAQSKFEETARFQADIHKGEVRKVLTDITHELKS